MLARVTCVRDRLITLPVIRSVSFGPGESGVSVSISIVTFACLVPCSATSRTGA